jgi:DNA-directed RNA polymerase specialized sigma24 family protein
MIPQANNHTRPPEDKLIASETRAERRAIAKEALASLTPEQRRHYVAHHAFGQTAREIAEKEGVAQIVVDRSIRAAERKIKCYTK